MRIDRFHVRARGATLSAVRFGEGPPLVALHPLAFSKACFFAEVLGAAFTTVAFDQRGHGETAAEGGLDPETMAGDIGAVLDHLGWDRAVVGGTSLGAATSLVFARRHPERVTLLIQDLPGFGPGSRRDPAKTEAMAEALARADLEEAARRATEGLSAPRAKAWTEALFADWGNYPAAELGPKLAAAFRATAGWRIVERWPEDLAEIRMPVRILALAGDPVHPLEVAEEMARAMPRAELVRRVPSLSPEAIARQWVEVATRP